MVPRCGYECRKRIRLQKLPSGGGGPEIGSTSSWIPRAKLIPQIRIMRRDLWDGWMDVWSRGDGLSPSFLLTCRQQFVKPPPTSDGRRSNAAAQELMIAIEAGCTGNREGGALKGLRVESLVHTSKYQIGSEITVDSTPIPPPPCRFLSSPPPPRGHLLSPATRA